MTLSTVPTIAGAGVPPRVLFLDDDERILKSLKALFRSRYDVLTTTEGQIALEYMRQGHVHVVVSDQRMPGMSGVEFLRKAKEVSPDTIRILLTGYSDLTAIVGSINDGEVFRFIDKPWDNQEIQETIGEAVAIAVKLARGAPPAPAVTAQRLSKMDETLLVISPHKPLYEEVNAIAKGSCQVTRALSLREALEVLKFIDVRVIVAEAAPGNEDISLFLRLLKSKYPQIVTLLVTSSADAETAIGLINQAQLFRLLVPPVSAEVLKSSIDAAIRHALSLKAAPVTLARHTVQAAPAPKRTSMSSWLVDGLRALPARLGF
jgi:eukaryotic-like serine/threonine-protein kinase